MAEGPLPASHAIQIGHRARIPLVEPLRGRTAGIAIHSWQLSRGCSSRDQPGAPTRGGWAGRAVGRKDRLRPAELCGRPDGRQRILRHPGRKRIAGPRYERPGSACGPRRHLRPLFPTRRRACHVLTALRRAACEKRKPWMSVVASLLGSVDRIKVAQSPGPLRRRRCARSLWSLRSPLTDRTRPSCPSGRASWWIERSVNEIWYGETSYARQAERVRRRRSENVRFWTLVERPETVSRGRTSFWTFRWCPNRRVA